MLIPHGYVITKHEQQSATDVDDADSVCLQREHLLTATSCQIGIKLSKECIIHSTAAIFYLNAYMLIFTPYTHEYRACALWIGITMQHSIFQQRLQCHARNVHAQYILFRLKTECNAFTKAQLNNTLIPLRAFDFFSNGGQ